MSETEPKDTEVETTSISSEDLESKDAREPLTIGRLGMWVFISTEVMLVAAIIAAYLVCRISTLGEGWPSGFVMGVSVPKGMINTFALVISGLTGWACYRAAKENRHTTAKVWLACTLVLGSIFLVIKTTEYHHKYQIGLLPTPGKRQIYDEAHVEYVAAVYADLKERIATLERRSSELSEQGLALTEAEKEQLELCYDLKQNMVEKTATNVGRSINPYLSRLSMSLMAYQIFANPDTERNVIEVVEPEHDQMELQLGRFDTRLEYLQRRIRLVDEQIPAIEEEIEQLKLLKPGSKELEEREQWLAVKRKQAGDLNIEVKRVENSRVPIEGRFRILETYLGSDEFPSVNEKHHLRLPVVIRNGQAWISMYLLMTGVHLLHLLAGMAALLWWLPRKLDSKRAPALYVTCMFWQFVDVMWLCIFWLIYF